MASSPPLPSWKRALRALAWTGVVASFPLWGAAFLIAPFVPLPGEQRAALAALLLLIAEAVFWLGAFYLGGDVVARFRRRFRAGGSTHEQGEVAADKQDSPPPDERAAT
jgi:hypothetical protein